MIRTQIYIPDEMHGELKTLARREGVNFSQLVREGVGIVIERRRRGRKEADWKKFLGAGGRGGPKDLSTRIDEYLYGDERA